MVTEVVVKKQGNSLGIILPHELVESEGLKENKKIHINITKKADLSDIFGSAKKLKKINGQKLKNMAREGWKK